MAETAKKIDTMEVPEGGIADFVMSDEDAEEVYGPDDDGTEEFGDEGIAQFTAITKKHRKGPNHFHLVSRIVACWSYWEERKYKASTHRRPSGLTSIRGVPKRHPTPVSSEAILKAKDLPRRRRLTWFVNCSIGTVAVRATLLVATVV